MSELTVGIIRLIAPEALISRKIATIAVLRLGVSRARRRASSRIEAVAQRKAFRGFVAARQPAPRQRDPHIAGQYHLSIGEALHLHQGVKFPGILRREADATVGGGGTDPAGVNITV